jgi:hypothetical protein
MSEADKMAAGKHTFNIEQGATFDPIIQYLNPAPDPDNDPDTPGPPIDITGYDARMKARTGSKTGPVFLDLTIGSGIIILSEALGQFQLDVDDTATAALTEADFDGGAFYDFEIIEPGGKVIRLIEGSIKFSLNVTA